MDSKAKKTLRKFIDELSLIRGRHTELVSVYIPAGYDIIKIIQHLAQEQGTAKNIKDKNTRDHVIESLEKMIRHLRIYKRTPENGLAAFSGNISDREGQTNIKVWSIEPPDEINTRLYRCDQTFVLDLLEGMLEHKETYGLIVIDRREATVGFLKGTRIEKILHETSDVPGKTTKGGQSQQRYARLRDEAAMNFFKRVAEKINKEFFEKADLKGIIIGGPGPTKEDFFEGSYLFNEIKKKVLGLKDLSYTGEFGLQELVDKSKDLLKKQIIMEEKAVLEEFFVLLGKGSDKVVYKEKDINKAIEYGAVEVLIISDSCDDSKIDELEKKAEAIGAKVKIVSDETREGVQLKDLGGVVAILRYAIS